MRSRLTKWRTSTGNSLTVLYARVLTTHPSKRRTRHQPVSQDWPEDADDEGGWLPDDTVLPGNDRFSVALSTITLSPSPDFLDEIHLFSLLADVVFAGTPSQEDFLAVPEYVDPMVATSQSERSSSRAVSSALATPSIRSSKSSRRGSPLIRLSPFVGRLHSYDEHSVLLM